MSDPVVGRAVQQVSEQALQQGATQAKSPQDVDLSSQMRFEQAMQAGQTPDAGQVGQVSQAGQLDQAGSADATATSQITTLDPSVQSAEAGKPTLGDAILEGIEKMKTSHDSHMDRIHTQITSTQGGEMSIQDAMKLQFEVMQMSIEQDLTTKVADKTSQGVQTLFRNQ